MGNEEKVTLPKACPFCGNAPVEVVDNDNKNTQYAECAACGNRVIDGTQ